MSYKNVSISTRVRNDDVTGSSIEFVVRANNEHHKYLIDKGLFLGLNENQEENFLLEQYSDIEALFLTHAHVDHCGQIPHIIKNGYNGPIYMSKQTAAISQELIQDEFYVLEQNDDNFTYTKEDGRAFRRMINNTVCVSSFENIQLPNATFTMLDNAHVLGANMVYFKTKHAISNLHILVSGDYRKNHPFLKTRSIKPFLKKNKVDVLFLEATYGNRDKDTLDNTLEALNEEIMKILNRGGRALLPVFSFDRAQVILYYLAQLQYINPELRKIPIYVDGLLMQKITHIYMRNKDKFSCRQGDLIPQNLINIVGKPDRERLISDKKPKIILSTSGQMHSGTIRHHIFNMIEEPLDGIVAVGYIGHKTGQDILNANKGDVITYNGREVTVNCTRSQLNGFSAHADRAELADLVQKVAELNPKLNVVLYHGSNEAKEDLRQYIADLGILPKNKITIPTSKQLMKIDKHTISSGKLLDSDEE